MAKDAVGGGDLVDGAVGMAKEAMSSDVVEEVAADVVLPSVDNP